MIYIIDGMLYVRRELEKDFTGRAPRKIINAMLSMQPGDVALWCWDAPGSRATRQKIYPAYKAKRMPHPDDIWPLIKLVRAALVHTPALQFECPTFEADDIIGTLLRKYPDVQKHVHSTDRDLSQAFDTKTTADFDCKIRPEHVRLYKTCVGDPSDCITGIPGFGEKTWADADKKQLHYLIQNFIKKGEAENGNREYDKLTSRVRRWLDYWPNIQTLEAMWQITGLYPVPEDVLTKGMTPGHREPEKADAILKEFRH